MHSRFAETMDPHMDDRLIEQATRYYEASEFDKARAAADELLRRTPQDYAALYLAGLIATAQKQLPAATDFLKQALKQAPNPQTAAASWCALGRVLRAAGDLRQAEEALRRAIRIDHRNSDYPIELAYVYAESWKLKLAIETLRNAAKRFFTDPNPCVALGNILNKYGRQDDALKAYGLAIQRKPDYAEAHIALGTTLSMLGRFTEAEVAIREALRIDPMIKTFYQLAQTRRFNLDTSDIEIINRRLDPANDTSKGARVDALFALSGIYDKRKDFQSAYRCLKEANRLQRSRIEFSITEYIELSERIISLFTPDLLIRYSGKSRSDLAPIFVMGMPRSGTTLTEQMLAAHSQVQGGGELTCIVQIAKHLSVTWNANGNSALGDDTTVADDIQSAAAQYREMTMHLSSKAPRFTDKLLGNFFYIGIIYLMFPKASIIYCHRNPVATCFSCFQNYFAQGNSLFSYEFTELGAFYKLHDRLMRHWQNVLPGHILTVEYENMVKNPESEIKRVLEFCCLEFEPGCLEFHTSKRPVATASIMQVREPIYKSSMEHWKYYEQFLGPLIRALQ